MRHDDDIVFAAQIGSRLNVILVNQVKWDFPSIERKTDPSDFFGILPGRVDRDSWQIHIHEFNCGHGVHHRCDQSQIFDLPANACRRVTARLHDKRAGGKLRACSLK